MLVQIAWINPYLRFSKIDEVLDNIIRLCEAGRFNDAIELIDKTLVKDNTNSHIYRLRGQANLELGKIDSSINDLIQSLKINPKNIESLILIGNIYFNQKNDSETAKNYFNKALQFDPDNSLVKSNLAGVFAKGGEFKKALLIFDQILSDQPKFINALLGKAVCHFNLNEFYEAFELASFMLRSHKPSKTTKHILDQGKNLLFESGKRYTEVFEETPDNNKLLLELKSFSDKEIKVEIDHSISTPAKLEVAHYKDRAYHVVKYKQDSKFNVHFLYHELMHLKFILQAKNVGENELFTSSEAHFESFKKQYPTIKKNLAKAGINDPSASNGLYRQLFDGLSLQLYNAPIDLFIEDYLYKNFKHLRPIQFLSILQMIDVVFQGQSNDMMKNIVPSRIRDVNLTMAIPQMILTKELFGVDEINKVSNKNLTKRGQKLFDDFLELRNDKSEGEEYDLINWWSEELGLGSYYSLKKDQIGKTSFAKRKEWLPDELIKALEKDPYSLEDDLEFEEEQMRLFQESQAEGGINMAVVFYIKDALNYIDAMQVDEIKKIGFEIAEMGRSGIDPNSDETYNLSTVPNMTFSGWRMLAWMYTTWMKFNPKLAVQMGLEFDKEFKLASGL